MYILGASLEFTLDMMDEHDFINNWWADDDDDDDTIGDMLTLSDTPDDPDNAQYDAMDIANLGAHGDTAAATEHCCLGPGSCVLSRYMGEYSMNNPVETGFLGVDAYITPLFVCSLNKAPFYKFVGKLFRFGRHFLVIYIHKSTYLGQFL